jgi:hypothetical protein
VPLLNEQQFFTVFVLIIGRPLNFAIFVSFLYTWFSTVEVIMIMAAINTPKQEVLERTNLPTFLTLFNVTKGGHTEGQKFK